MIVQLTKETQQTEHGITVLSKIRIGQYVFGIRVNMYKHGTAVRFLAGHIADCVGVLNRFENTISQALFIDFDKCNLEDVENYCRWIQFHYHLGEMYVFESSKGHYNMIDPDLLPSELVKEILIQCNIADKKFVTIYMLNGDNTIRLSPKFTETEHRTINHILTISGSPESKWPRHYALSELLFRYVKIPLSKTCSYDLSEQKDLIFKEYETLQW
jgi:hypothetical protein